MGIIYKNIKYNGTEMGKSWSKIYLKDGQTLKAHHENFIRQTIIDIFKDKKYWGLSFEGEKKDRKYGVIKTGFSWKSLLGIHFDDDWSMINFYDNNWSFFVEMLNTFNINYENEIDFFHGDLDEEFDKYKHYILENKKEIFHPKGKYFARAMECVYNSRGIGNKNSNLTIDTLKNQTGVTNVIQYNNGNRNDLKGTDGRFDLFSVTKTIQMKTFSLSGFKFDGENYVITIPSGKYDVDFISFCNGYHVLIFKNTYYNPTTSSYTFPKDFLWATNGKPF